MKNYFLDKKFDGFLDKLWVKKSLDSFLKSSNIERGIVFDLGGGETPYKEIIKKKNVTYFSGDLRFSRKIDLILNLNYPLPFKDRISDFVIITQVLEHLPNPLFTLLEIYRVLIPGGKLFITVPSFFRLHELPNDFYRFTYYGFEFLLQEAGFTNFKIWGHGDEFTILAEGLIFAIRRIHLPKKILLFFVAVINSIFYLRDKKKPFSSEPKRDVIGLSAIAVK
ncbi:class I SAM-dependent methyltransferase [candidate division WOR-3 bacterium]|nr:class I SAM-dependent methyltransferase [candidate division WOR-3 bacterium]